VELNIVNEVATLERLSVGQRVCPVNAGGRLSTPFNAPEFAWWHCRNSAWRVIQLNRRSIPLISVSLAPCDRVQAAGSQRTGLEQISLSCLRRHFNYRGKEVAHSHS
jgi:hypothetical protein